MGKKKLPDSVDLKRQMIEPNQDLISVRRQCDLVGLPRSCFYYEPAVEAEENLHYMRLIDEQYMRTPFWGSRNMTWYLNDQGHSVNRKRVQRLMRLMGIEAIYPKPKTSEAAKEHRKYPYLLRNVPILRPNQVWSTDITYLPMPKGFMHLVAVMDWYSRCVLSWKMSNTLDTTFCLEALEQALGNARPEIFNTDQGAQFTGRLEEANIAISMDGRGRALDNVFVERLWRSLKYEEIYIWNHETVPELEKGVERYFQVYNSSRPHQALQNRTPQMVYEKGGLH